MSTKGYESFTASDAARLNASKRGAPATPKPSKYRAVKTTVDGIVFDSSKEARRYSELKILLRAGLITALQRQPELTISVNGMWICDYVCDFLYIRDGVRVWEDVKGMKTPVYRLKKKLVKAVHDIDISEV